MDLQKMQIDDHSTLIRIEEKVGQIMSTIEELKESTSNRIDKIEVRVADLEKSGDVLSMWQHDFKLTWRLVVGFASFVGGLTGSALWLVLKVFRIV